MFFFNCVQYVGENGPNLQKCVSVIRKKEKKQTNTNHVLDLMGETNKHNKR